MDGPASLLEELTATVALLTYKRPAELALALPAVLEQARAVSARVDLLVIDNDPEGSAAELVATFAASDVRYLLEPTPGIAAARNRALEEATGTVIVFIDDDEWPGPGWLGQLLGMYVETRAAGVVGAVRSQFATTPDPWIVAGRFFDRLQRPTGSVVEVAATNNLLLELATLRRHGLRFDERLGLSGGSDTLLTRQLSQAGGRLLWCAEAVVFDMVPADRLSRRWVLRRAFRMGNSASVVEMAVAGSAARLVGVRLRQLGRGLVRVGGGCAELAVGTLGRSMGQRARGARRCARGAGLLAGALGHTYVEYRRPAPA